MTMPAPSPDAAAPSKRPDVRILATLDLGQDIPELAGKELRLQLTTYAPGGANLPHSHAGKVEVVYALAGAITECHGDGRVLTYRPGDAFTANKDTFHHMENNGAEPAQMVVAMIVDKPR